MSLYHSHTDPIWPDSTFKEPRNHSTSSLCNLAGRVRQPYLSYQPVMLRRLEEWIPWNGFLDSLKNYKFGPILEEYKRDTCMSYLFFPFYGVEVKQTRGYIDWR
jgi:hypothetical protein